jgi:hypothetical protein
MQLQQYIHAPASRIVFGILIGLGLASLFRKSCNSENCFDFKGPNMKDIKNVVYKYDGNCFEYEIINSKCHDERIPVRL